MRWLALIVLLAGCAGKPYYRVVELPPLAGYHFSDAHAIDDRGVVAGHCEEAGVSRATQWRNGVPHDMGVAYSGDENGRRRAGRDLVGSRERALRSGQYAATIQRGKNVYDLNECIPDDSEWQLWTARSINRKGRIVGAGLYQGRNRGFLLIPTRKPSPRAPARR